LVSVIAFLQMLDLFAEIDTAQGIANGFGAILAMKASGHRSHELHDIRAR